MTEECLDEQFGRIDIYLFDQILRGRLDPTMRVLDAGCGDGRNAHYLLRAGAEVFGVDRDADRIEEIRTLAARLAPALPPANFQVQALTSLSFTDGAFDFIICSAVLHFADDEPHFEAIMREMWRVLAPGGVFFARLASTIGIENRVTRSRGRWYALPDGTDRFLVDEPYLRQVGEALGAQPLDPLKTTNVQNIRAMTTWVLGKPVGARP